ncbi:hypothetical protein NQ315_014782 [Exocentrus adspersus]|uniref:Uncharacterized protein n=1 Tax=Exocentrus adspersus TaxID=1586481 RepID=A0AAV8VM24_9CUCU|nr:hypothetical protein NQ315_014782 [Exocentrus adspersus]
MAFFPRFKLANLDLKSCSCGIPNITGRELTKFRFIAFIRKVQLTGGLWEFPNEKRPCQTFYVLVYSCIVTKPGNSESQPSETGESVSGQVNRVSVKLPPFMPNDSEMWLQLAERSFTLAHIKNEETKFSYLCGDKLRSASRD